LYRRGVADPPSSEAPWAAGGKSRLLQDVRRLPMTCRAALALVLLVVVTAFTGCGGDDESTTTVTELATETAASETSAGPAVAELQQVMTTLGYYSGPIDGIYGDATTEGVKAMQEDLGVTADCIYGSETHAALEDKGASIVTQVQTVLAEYGYYDGEIDGSYGPETQAAVTELQQDVGVTADGRVGPETVNAFNEAVADGTIEPA
jgi:peptidoglycan hydrolase-like protein with peptidoglycan-binding domain